LELSVLRFAGCSFPSQSSGLSRTWDEKQGNEITCLSLFYSHPSNCKLKINEMFWRRQNICPKKAGLCENLDSPVGQVAHGM
jgi:hypothetical protein